LQSCAIPTSFYSGLCFQKEQEQQALQTNVGGKYDDYDSASHALLSEKSVDHEIKLI
jgi:hypothetical protein